MNSKLLFILSLLLVGQLCITWLNACIKWGPTVLAGARVAGVALLAYQLSGPHSNATLAAMSTLIHNSQLVVEIIAVISVLYVVAKRLTSKASSHTASQAGQG